MEKEIHNRLFEIATRRQDFVTPLILDYYELRSYGFDDKRTMKIIEDRYLIDLGKK
jgi:hypothetical protein